MLTESKFDVYLVNPQLTYVEKTLSHKALHICNTANVYLDVTQFMGRISY